MKSFKRFVKVQWSLIAGIVGGVCLVLAINMGWYIPLFILALVALVALTVSMYRFNERQAAATEKARQQLAEIEARKENYAVSE